MGKCGICITVSAATTYGLARRAEGQAAMIGGSAINDFLKVKPPKKCPECEGTGKIPARGRLRVTTPPLTIHHAKGKTCPKCKGKGTV